MTDKRSKCEGCSVYKYCDTVVSSIKLCKTKNK